MYGGKYSAVIGREIRFLYTPSINMQAMRTCQPITATVFAPLHQTTDLRQTTV
jgi:hypothetical protein